MDSRKRTAGHSVVAAKRASGPTWVNTSTAVHSAARERRGRERGREREREREGGREGGRGSEGGGDHNRMKGRKRQNKTTP